MSSPNPAAEKTGMNSESKDVHPAAMPLRAASLKVTETLGRSSAAALRMHARCFSSTRFRDQPFHPMLLLKRAENPRSREQAKLQARGQ